MVDCMVVNEVILIYYSFYYPLSIYLASIISITISITILCSLQPQFPFAKLIIRDCRRVLSNREHFDNEKSREIEQLKNLNEERE